MKNLLWLLFLCGGMMYGQSNDAIVKKQLNISPTEEPIQIDGVLSESTWSKGEVATDFYLNKPVDDQLAQQKTEVRVTHDDRFLYVAATCWDDPNYVIQTLKRDNFVQSDGFGVMIDPVAQQATGFGFGVSALGVQTEVLVAKSTGLDAGDDASDSWDNKWQSAVKNYDDRYTVEIAIPFKTLRYNAGQSNWAINFVRIEPGSNEVHVWSPIPRQFEFIEMAYYGQLNWEQAPGKAGSNISLIPYSTARIDQDFTNGTKTNPKLAVGGDAKVAITPKLNLDLTVNPDFSQVEVDQQVTNLTRFSIFFPERRQFFQENDDVFSEYGQFADRPFYSRRIGLDDSGRTVPIAYGVRLSGNLNERLRIGAFNMHSRGDEDRAGQNYTSVTFQQRLWKRSAFKGIFLNRQGFSESEKIAGDYGRNLGGEFNFSTPSGKWQSTLGYLQSFKEGFDNKNRHLYGRMDYSGTNFRGFLSIQNIGENYFTDMGFNRRVSVFNPETNTFERVGFTQVANMLNYYYYPKNSKSVNFHWSGAENFVWVNPDGSINEWYTRLRHFIFFKNTSQLRFRLNNNYVNLLFPFAITEPALPAGDYNMTEFNVQFNTDLRKRLNTEMFIVYGQFYGGTKLTYRGSISYRIQPWANFTLGLEQNNIWWPETYEKVNLTLASARIEINFSKSLFWTTFFQYNTQADNFNINSRLQWRYAPMSDLFFVYTDNYLIDGMFGPKTRSFVLKVNYWLTL